MRFSILDLISSFISDQSAVRSLRLISMCFILITHCILLAFIVHTIDATPTSRKELVVSQVLAARVLRERATTTAPDNILATNICGWLGGDAGMPAEKVQYHRVRQS